MALTQKKIKKYGSYFWLIPSLLFWPPLGICLLIKGLRLTINHEVYFVHYKGNYFWLVLWAIFCPPIAVILGAINGFDVKIQQSFIIEQ